RSAVELATTLIYFWITRATAEGARWLDELLSPAGEPVPVPWAYWARGFLAVLQNDPEAAQTALRHAVTTARATGQPGVLADSHAMASIAARMAGDRAAARRLLDEALAAAGGLDELGTTLLIRQAQALTG